jgi:hypothetical protein
MAGVSRTIPPFDSGRLRKIAGILGDTHTGLTGSQIGSIFELYGLPDPDPKMTKFTRMFEAFVSAQKESGTAQPVLRCVEAAMESRFHRGKLWRGPLNQVLSPCGIQIGEDGVIRWARDSSRPQLRAISIENFKGICNRTSLEMQPITLLFGANSAGKSTFLHALHYAREIFERHNLNADQTISGGKYIDLGGFGGFIHQHDKSRDLRIRFDVSLGNDGLPDFDADYDRMSQILDVPFDSFTRPLTSVGVELTVSWSTLEECPYVSTTAVFLDETLFGEITAQPNLQGAVVSHLNMAHPSLITMQEARRKSGYPPDLFEVGSLLSAAMEYCGTAISPGDGKRIELSGRGDALPALDGPLEFELEPIDQPDGNEISDEWIANQLKLAKEFVSTVSEMIVGPCQIVRDQLNQLRYLGPLRETPSRSFQPPRFADIARWSSGLGAWDALETGSDSFVQKVAEWLGDEKKLDSGYQIERRTYKEVDLGDPLIRKLLSGRAFDETEEDSKLSLERIPTSSRIVIVPRGSELDLRPHDVGIGITQVVPVVVTVLHGNHRLLAIEQPELHLHPKLQAELGDLFIESALGERQHLIVLETHSEHLILRLLRRIRETSDGELPDGKLPLRPDDIAVYFIESAAGGVKATKLRVDETGEFVDQWPEGFFEERAKELF